MSTPSKMLDLMRQARKSGLAGDLGIGGVVGVTVGVVLYVQVPDATVMGFPISMVWSLAAAVSVALLSTALGFIPDADESGT